MVRQNVPAWETQRSVGPLEVVLFTSKPNGPNPIPTVVTFSLDGLQYLFFFNSRINPYAR